MNANPTTPGKDRREYMREWRKQHPESIQASHHKYDEKRAAKRIELVSEYTKTLAQKFPGFILMLYRGEPLMSSVLPRGMSVTITGIASPDDLATVKVTKDDRVIDVLSRIPHDKLYQAIDWEKVRLAWG